MRSFFSGVQHRTVVVVAVRVGVVLMRLVSEAKMVTDTNQPRPLCVRATVLRSTFFVVAVEWMWVLYSVEFILMRT